MAGRIRTDTRSSSGYGIPGKFFITLWKYGPLVTAKRVNEYLQERMGRVSGFKDIFLSADRRLRDIQHYLDGSFDRKYGTDTSGSIPLDHLTIDQGDVTDSIWYEPMSEKTFRRIMERLDIDFSNFEFLDFGSGKGRVLLLASGFGYRNITGVEFARELHLVAVENINKYNRLRRYPVGMQSVWMDAVRYCIPDVPLVIFFFSPFKGKVMRQVLENVSGSLSLNPRKFVLIFHGSNPDTIHLLHESKFLWREIEIRPDWSRFRQYRTFLSDGMTGERGTGDPAALVATP